MKKNLIVQLLITACCWLVCSVPVQAQFDSGATGLTEAGLVDRAWHLSSKEDGNPLVRASGNNLFANNNTINGASTFVIDDGPNDNKWWTADVRWFHIKSQSTGQYLTVPGNVPGIALTLAPLIEGQVIAMQQFRLVATLQEGWYKLRSRMGDLVIEVNSSGQLIVDSPKLDPSANQKFAFNLALPGGSRYAIFSAGNQHFFSDNGVLAEGAPAVHIRNSNASIIWQFQAAGGGYYRIYNTLTKQYLALPPGGGAGSELIMTTSTGTNSHWELKRNNTTFFIAHRSNPGLLINMNNFPATGNPLYCTVGGVVGRDWILAPLPNEPDVVTGNYDRIADGELQITCGPIYGTVFKKGLIERVGLNPEHTESYFAFIREAIAAEKGADKVDEMLIRFDLNNPGHRVDLVFMVRKYITEVLPLIPRNNWSLQAQQAVIELEEKILAVRIDYAVRINVAWDAYSDQFATESWGFSQLIDNIDASGFVWPDGYKLEGTQVGLMEEYTVTASSLGIRNTQIVGATFLGASVIVGSGSVGAAITGAIFNSVLPGSASAALSASISAPVFAGLGPVVSVATLAAAGIAAKSMEVIELQALLSDISNRILMASIPVYVHTTMSGNNLVDRIKLLNDLDYLMGAPVTNGFQFNDDDNAYPPPFTASCNATVTLPLDENGAATLTPAMCASVSLQSCGTPIQYFLSKSQFDCDDLGANNSVAYAALTTIDGIPTPYVQRCSLTVNVVDEILPTITCPGNQTLTLGGTNCSAILPDYIGLATNVADNCGGVTVTQFPEAGTVVSGGGDMTVTLRVHPLNGVTITCTFIVTKIDNTPPLVVCPLPQTLVLSSDCTATIPDYSLLTTTYDACGIGTLTQLAPPGFTVSGAGSITALMILTDVNNNTSQCSFTITKVDNTPPTITCPATQTLALGANCTAALPDYTSLATTADHCGVQGVTQSPAAGTLVANSGNMTVTLTVTDISGNSTQCTFTVTKVDNTPPSITCPGTQTLVLGPTCTAALLDYGVFTSSSDNCGVSSVTQSPAPGTVVSNAGNMTVTLTATDVNGNSTQCTFTVTKVDNTPPAVQCFNQTLTFNGQNAIPLNSADLVDATDNCGVASIVLSPASITCLQLGQVVPVTVTVRDVNNNTGICISNITVTGLPCGWSHNSGSVGCPSTAAFAPATGVWTATATGCYYANPYTNDAVTFAQRQLCGNGSITARVTSIGGIGGWAGVTMRETNAAGAKKVQLMTNLSNFVRAEVRYNTGGQAYPADLFSFQRFWVRIVRQGNEFTGFVSSDGNFWIQTFSVLAPMNSCIQMGLVMTNFMQNGTGTATFANVVTTGSNVPPLVWAGGIDHAGRGESIESIEQPYDIEVYPNPTSGELNVGLTQYAGRAVRLELYSLTGQLLRFVEIDEVQTAVERIDLSAFQSGMYWVKVITNGLPDATRRVVIAR